jgi:putative peptidoglycan lipid II flippase
MRLKRFLFEGETLRLMGFTVLTKPLGLITQMLMAAYFGAGHQLDAYAFSLFPIVFFSQAIQRIFSAIAIPQIIKIRKELAPEKVAGYQNAIIIFFYVPVILFLLSFLIWGDLFVNLVGRQLPPETKDFAYRFLRFLALPGILVCLVGLNSSLLNLNKKFRIPALMPLLNAAVMLLCLVLLNPRLGIWALPVGFAASYLVQTPIIMIRSARTGSFTLARPYLPPGSIRLLWSLSWMIIVTQVLLMINTFVDKWFATGLEAGSISSINYSMTLMNLGVQFFSMSLTVVMFTRMSEFFAANDYHSCDRYIQTNLVKVANLVVPVSLGLFVISPEIVRILFQRGAFDAADAVRTSGTLAMYLLGLPALIINGVITKVFQSLQRLREKIFLAFQYIATNIIGNVILVKSLATVGLAISSSAAINLHLLLSLVVLHYIRSGLNINVYMATIGRAYLMAAFSWVAYTLTGIGTQLDGLVNGQSIQEALVLAVLKFSVIIGLYGFQVFIWFRFFRKSQNIPH